MHMKEIHLTVSKLRKHLHLMVRLARMSCGISKGSVVQLGQISEGLWKILPWVALVQSDWLHWMWRKVLLDLSELQDTHMGLISNRFHSTPSLLLGTLNHNTEDWNSDTSIFCCIFSINAQKEDSGLVGKEHLTSVLHLSDGSNNVPPALPTCVC